MTAHNHTPGHADAQRSPQAAVVSTHLLSSVGAEKVSLQEGHWMPVVSCFRHFTLLLLSLRAAPFFAFSPFLAVRCTTEGFVCGRAKHADHGHRALSHYPVVLQSLIPAPGP